MERPLNTVSAVMLALYLNYWGEEGAKPQSIAAVCRSIYIPILTYGQQPWDLKEWVSLIQAAEMSFLRSVALGCLRDRVRSSDIGKETQSIAERRQLRWFGLIRIRLASLLWEVLQAHPTRRRCRGKTKNLQEGLYLLQPGKISGYSRETEKWGWGEGCLEYPV